MPDRWHPYPDLPELTGHPTPPRLLVLEQLWSPELRNHRDLLVALPADAEQDGTPLPVVFLHDGQNLFDPHSSFAGHWQLAHTLAEMIRHGTPAILVGVPNTGAHRLYEYSPFEDVLHRGGGGDRYLDFLLARVRPRILQRFPARADAAGTVIAGSSMGGLISAYAHFRHPETFGASGILSPALWFADGAIFDYIGASAVPGGRIHLDIGTDEGEDAVADARRLHGMLRDVGYRDGLDLAYVEEHGADHTEGAWARRMRTALPWLVAAADAPARTRQPAA